MPKQHPTWQAQQDFALRAAALAASILADSAELDDEANKEAAADRSIVLLTGSDEIGTIGLAMAYYLAEWDAWVQVLTLAPSEQHAGGAADALNKLIAADVPLAWAEDGWELPPCDLLIDALSNGRVSPDDRTIDSDALRKLIELTNSSLAPILSVGLPSAVERDGADPLAVLASHTIPLNS